MACLSAMTFTNQVNAEVLTIEGLTPADVPGFTTVKTLSIERFGGSDGQDLAFKLEDRLQGVSVYGEPYFDVLGGRSAVEADATLTGTATAGIDRYETTEYRDRCIARDKDDKCTKRKSIKVKCLKQVVDFRAQVRASRFEDGRRIYSESFPEKAEQTICFGDDQEFSSGENEVRKMIANVASAVRNDLAPRQYRRQIRVLESRKGMGKADSKYFKAAVKMTKKDASEACGMWDEAAANGLVHISLAFNRGLCAEMRGDLEGATALYSEAQALSSRKLEVRQGLDRVGDHQRALDDWELRNSAGSGEDSGEQG